MNKIRKGDDVVVIAGKDKGKRGTVLSRVDTDSLLVEGINRVKKHTKPNPMKGQPGGIVEKEMPIQVSNVALFNPPLKRRIVSASGFLTTAAKSGCSSRMAKWWMRKD